MVISRWGATTKRLPVRATPRMQPRFLWTLRYVAPRIHASAEQPRVPPTSDPLRLLSRQCQDTSKDVL